MTNIKSCLFAALLGPLALSSFAQAAPAPAAQEIKFQKIPELSAEWKNFESPAWDKAAKITDFKVATGEKTAPPAQQPTEVRIAHDGKTLFVRFTATDSESAKAKTSPPPLDEFVESFPRGDHAEIWLKTMGNIVLAFDKNGNRTDALNYDQDYISGFRVKSRSTPNGWESVVMIPLQPFINVNKAPKEIGISFVRHLDHGDGKPERSTQSGQKAAAMPGIKIDW